MFRLCSSIFSGYGANDVAFWGDMHSRMNIQVVTDVINPCCFIFDRSIGWMFQLSSATCYEYLNLNKQNCNKIHYGVESGKLVVMMNRLLVLLNETLHVEV